MFFFHFTLSLFLLKCIFLCFNDFPDKCSTKHLLSLVNKVSLDRILRSEVYVNEADGQLRVAHLILGYTPISLAFQAPKCVIRARDPWLHHISVYTIHPTTCCGHSFGRNILIPARSSRREGRRRRKRKRKFCGPNRLFGRFWSIQPTTISQEPTRRNGYPKKALEKPDGADRGPAKKRCTWEICSI